MKFHPTLDVEHKHRNFYLNFTIVDIKLIHNFKN